MSRDDILRMAREAGFDCAPDGHIYNEGTADSIPLDDALERFFHAAHAAGAAAEREACAKVCEEDAFVDQWKGLSEAVKRIRARGQQ